MESKSLPESAVEDILISAWRLFFFYSERVSKSLRETGSSFLSCRPML